MTPEKLKSVFAYYRSVLDGKDYSRPDQSEG